MTKQIDQLNDSLLATALGVMSGKINTRHGLAAAKIARQITDGAHKASIHTRYQKAVPRVNLFDKALSSVKATKVVDDIVDAKAAAMNAQRNALKLTRRLKVAQ